MDETQKVRIQRNFRLACEIHEFVYRVKYHQLKKKHPDLDHEALQKRTHALMDAACGK